MNLKYTNEYNEVNIIKVLKHTTLLIIILSVLFGSFGTVGAGERGVRTRFNKVIGTVQPGLFFKLPFIDNVIKIDVKTQTINYDKNGLEGDSKDTSQLFGASKDLQDVSIGVMVNYHVDYNKVIDIYSQYNNVKNYSQNVLEPIVRETVKSISAQYTAEELVTKRAEYSDKVNLILIEKFLLKGAIMERFNITNFEFSRAFSSAIEAKVTAVQNAEAAKNKLEQIKFEAQQTIETATATAKAQEISAKALAAQGGTDYVALKAIEKWNGVLPVQMIPGSSVPFVNLSK